MEQQHWPCDWYSSSSKDLVSDHFQRRIHHKASKSHHEPKNAVPNAHAAAHVAVRVGAIAPRNVSAVNSEVNQIQDDFKEPNVKRKEQNVRRRRRAEKGRTAAANNQAPVSVEKKGSVKQISPKLSKASVRFSV